MPRFAVRHRRPTDAKPTATGIVPVVVGLAMGATLGFLLGEWLGPASPRIANRRARPAATPSMAELVSDAQSVLVADVQLREWQLDVVPVGRGRIELRGWVGTRAARTRAARLVRAAVTAEAVLNSVLVRGEDDLPDTDADMGNDDLVSA